MADRLHADDALLVLLLVSQFIDGGLFGLVIGLRLCRSGFAGRGGFAVTWRALDLTTRAPVAVKILSLRTVDHWKAVELFEREVLPALR